MGVVVRPADRPGDLGWMVWQHGEVYAETLGWDTSFEALVARIVADYARRRSRPARAGLGRGARRPPGRLRAVRPRARTTPPVAVLRILLVTPTPAARAPAAALVDTCVAHARPPGAPR